MLKTSGLLLTLAATAGLALPAFAAERLYVPLGEAAQVATIDLATNTVTGTVRGTQAAHGMAIAPIRGLLVVGSYAEQDPAEGAIPAKPEDMSAADHLAHHSRQPAAAKAEDAAVSVVSILRIDDQKIVRRVTVPGAVHHVEVTPTEGHAVVTLPNNDGIAIINLATFDVTGPIQTGALPNYAVAATDGRTVYVSNAGDNTVSEVDIIDGTVRRSFPTGDTPEHLVLSPDGKTLYVADALGGTVTAIAIESGTKSATYEIGGMLHGIGVSADGGTLYAVARENNAVVAIDLADGGIRRQPLSPEPYHLAVAGQPQRLYVSSAERDVIWVLDAKSLKPVAEIGLPGQAHQMAVSAR